MSFEHSVEPSRLKETQNIEHLEVMLLTEAQIICYPKQTKLFQITLNVLSQI